MQNKELPFIREMFENIAPRYDFLNRLLSLRQDVYWRKAMVRALRCAEKTAVLDVACGTGDVLLETARQQGRRICAVGVDFSLRMLGLGQAKVNAAGHEQDISLAAADAFRLPFREASFDAVTIAFGIRNIQDKALVLSEFKRVLKPGGQVLILELAAPEHELFRRLYLLYFRRLLPMLGWFISGHSQAYRYLPESVLKFPAALDFAKIMESVGFVDVKWRHLTLGIAVLFSGRKAISAGTDCASGYSYSKSN